MNFTAVIQHLNQAARMFRSNALTSGEAAVVQRFEALVVEYDAAIRKLTDGHTCAVDGDGRPLVNADIPHS